MLDEELELVTLEEDELLDEDELLELVTLLDDEELDSSLS